MRMAGMQGPRRIGTNLSGGRVFAGNPASMGEVASAQSRMMYQRSSVPSGQDGMIRSGVPEMNYHLAGSATVQTGGMVRQGISTSSGAIFTSPSFYSPYHTPSSWQIPTVRREVYKWCLGPKTLVTMADLTQSRIDELLPGDSIMTSDGVPGEVTVISRRFYSGKMRSIKVRGSSWKLETTPDHILYRVKEGHLSCRYACGFNFCREKQLCETHHCDGWKQLPKSVEIEEVRSDELNVGDFLYCPTNILTGQREDFSPEMMRLFGLHLADGTLTFKHRNGKKIPSSIRLTFGSKGTSELIDHITQIMKDEFDVEPNLRTVNGKLGEWKSLDIYRKEVSDLFLTHCGHGSKEKRISETLLSQKPELLRELVIGFILGDGGKSPNGQIAIKSVNLGLISQLKFILTGLGCIPTVEDQGNIYRIYINGVEANDLFASSSIPFGNYKTDQVERKHANSSRSIMVGDKVFHRIMEIEEEDYDGFVYDLRVDNETGVHKFLANFVVVSNCEYWMSNEARIAIAIDFYCFTPDMQVMMADGTSKPICDINDGDEVIRGDGNPGKVLRAMSRDASEEILTISADGIDPIECTLGHKLLRSTEETVEWVQAQEIREGDSLLSPTSIVDGNDDRGGYVERRVIGIASKHYSGPVYDLEIEDEHSYTVNKIACHNSEFPCSNIELECADASVKDFYEGLIKRIKLEESLPQILREYYGKGDAFVMCNLDCEECGGSGVDQGGKECDHKGATWRGISVLNPEEVEVSPFSNIMPEPPIYLLPNADLKRLVQTGQPKDIFQALPQQTREAVRKGLPILMDPLTITHLKHGSSSYQTYGQSIIRRLFPTLVYKDKLRQAQYLIAERHIVPIKIVKIGSEQRPASQEDINDVQERLAEVANDPLLTLVTHHAFDYEWVGSCLEKSAEVLTKDGFKHFDDVTEEDLIACYDPEIEGIVYAPYIERHQYDYDSDKFGPLINFSAKKYGITVTPNHRMWTKKRRWNNDEGKYDGEWMLARADEITDHDRFLTCLGSWEGTIPDVLPYQESGVDMLSDIELDDFLRFLGYYLSEGTLQRQAKPYDNKMCSVYIYQNGGEVHENIDSTMKRCFGSKVKTWEDNRYDNSTTTFKIHNTKLAEYLRKEYGHGCDEKRVPRWIMGLPSEQLKIFLDALVEGDGDISQTNNGFEKTRYSTTSKHLADAVQEIAFKLGHDVTMTDDEARYEPHHKQIYRINWTERRGDGTHPIRSRNIHKKEYQDWVFCFTVPTGMFITRQDGFIGIHGNSGKILQLTNEFDLIEGEMIDGLGLSKAILSGEGPTYANAQVGIEVLAKRLETVRKKISGWIEEKVFRPIAMFNGFTKTNERGEDEYIYPTVKWTDLRLRDNTPKVQYMWEARKAGDLSAQTFLGEALDVDFDQEVERIRLEEMSTVLSNPQLELGSPGGGMGAGYGGMPAGGDMGGMGGMMPPPTMGAGGAPPPPGGGSPPGGTAPPGGGDASGGMPTPIGMGPSANQLYENYMTVIADRNGLIERVVQNGGRNGSSSNIVVSGDGHRGSLPDDPDITDLTLMSHDGMNRVSFGPPRGDGKAPKQKSFFTSVEQALYKAILSQRLPYDFWAQYMVGGDPRMRVDGAFPQIKVVVEADGREWHADPSSIEKDKRRDAYLASQGWLVLRFTEEEIEKRLNEVMAVISKAINQKVQSMGTRVAVEMLNGNRRANVEGQPPTTEVVGFLAKQNHD